MFSSPCYVGFTGTRNEWSKSSGWNHSMTKCNIQMNKLQSFVQLPKQPKYNGLKIDFHGGISQRYFKLFCGWSLNNLTAVKPQIKFQVLISTTYLSRFCCSDSDFISIKWVLRPCNHTMQTLIGKQFHILQVGVGVHGCCLYLFPIHLYK